MLRGTRAFLLALAVLASPLPAGAQASTTVPRIGFLSASTAASSARQIDGFRLGLREQGYVEGSNIAIVMVAVGDPVAAKLVASLARPGGNVTGNSSISPEMAGKSLELLKEVAPNPANRVFQAQMSRRPQRRPVPWASSCRCWRSRMLRASVAHSRRCPGTASGR